MCATCYIYELISCFILLYQHSHAFAHYSLIHIHTRRERETHTPLYVSYAACIHLRNKLIATITTMAKCSKATAKMFPIKVYKNSNARISRRLVECEKYSTIGRIEMNAKKTILCMCVRMQNKEGEKEKNKQVASQIKTKYVEA